MKKKSGSPKNLALKLHRAEEASVKDIKHFLAKQDQRSRRAALSRIRFHDDIKFAVLNSVLQLKEDEAREFLEAYKSAHTVEEKAKSQIVEIIALVCQEWEESERGWGTRPDGFSLHFTVEDCKKYIEAYWSKMPDKVPDEYSRPRGAPYTVLVPANSKWVIDLGKNEQQLKLGVRYLEDKFGTFSSEIYGPFAKGLLRLNNR